VPQIRGAEQDHRPGRCDDLHLIRVRAHAGRVGVLGVDRRRAAAVRAGDDANRPLLRVNGVTHHIAESVCHGPSARRLA